MMIKNCKFCETKFSTHKKGVFYCTSTCRSRDRFLYKEHNNKKYKVWKDNYLKYPDFYNDVIQCDFGKINLCVECGKQYKQFRKTCSNICSKILKEKTTEKTTGAKHNLSKNSICFEERKQTCIMKYGVDNVLKVESVKEKIKKTLGVDNISQLMDVKIKKRITSEKNGYWTKTCDQDKYLLYKYHVYIFTNHNINKFGFIYWGKDFIKNWSFDKNHVDHSFSIFHGFKYNIPPYIIGSFCNLRFIDGKMNMKKGNKSLFSLSKLYELYNDFENKHTNVIELNKICNKKISNNKEYYEILKNKKNRKNKT